MYNKQCSGRKILYITLYRENIVQKTKETLTSEHEVIGEYCCEKMRMMRRSGMKWRLVLLWLMLVVMMTLPTAHAFKQFFRILRSKAHIKPIEELKEVKELPCIGSHRSLGTTRCIKYAETLREKTLTWTEQLFQPIIRYVANSLCALIFSFIMKVMNRFTVHRREVLLDHVFHRAPTQGLLTVSNHQSVADDPGLWAALLPWWRMNPDQFRWTICTEDVFFYVRSNFTF